MGARGPHDDFESAEEVLDAIGLAFAAGDWDTVRELTDPDGEHVTRHGTVHGPEQAIADFIPQMERWTISFYREELIDADGGALVSMLEVERRNPETGEVGMTAWPAIVNRVHRGKIVFLEGYVDRRKALADLGID